MTPSARRRARCMPPGAAIADPKVSGLLYRPLGRFQRKMVCRTPLRRRVRLERRGWPATKIRLCKPLHSGPKLPFGEAENWHSTLKVKGRPCEAGTCPSTDFLGDCWNWSTRNEPVAGHDCQQLLAVWRPAGIHNFLYIQKVLRTQVRGKDD